ncbi:hypothetical protein ACFWWT_22440 [Streptomyces sp. NPDC058676]|uniref:hypothetical protein n=1 Tax=unclassified Streptomyces TaxID=2593676 RepID=UPI0036643DB2
MAGHVAAFGADLGGQLRQAPVEPFDDPPQGRGSARLTPPGRLPAGPQQAHARPERDDAHADAGHDALVAVDERSDGCDRDVEQEQNQSTGPDDSIGCIGAFEGGRAGAAATAAPRRAFRDG